MCALGYNATRNIWGRRPPLHVKRGTLCNIETHSPHLRLRMWSRSRHCEGTPSSTKTSSQCGLLRSKPQATWTPTRPLFYYRLTLSPTRLPRADSRRAICATSVVLPAPRNPPIKITRGCGMFQSPFPTWRVLFPLPGWAALPAGPDNHRPLRRRSRL